MLISNNSFRPHPLRIEVHQQTKFVSCDRKVIDNLSGVNWKKFIDSF